MVIYCNRNINYIENFNHIYPMLSILLLLRFCWTSGVEYHVNGVNGLVLPSSLTSLMSAEDMIQWKLNIYFSDNTKFSVNLNLFRMVSCKHRNWLGELVSNSLPVSQNLVSESHVSHMFPFYFWYILYFLSIHDSPCAVSSLVNI